MEKREIYLDNSATTKTLESVNKKMLDVLENAYGNPSSLHNIGMRAEKEFAYVKNTLAKILSCTPEEIYITSGGTESNNIAITGYLNAVKKRARHVICTSVEHPAVYEAIKYAESEGFEVDILDVDENGVIDIGEFEKMLREDTALVCVMHVNNEVGSIMPLEKLKPIMKKKAPKAVLFSDCVQSFGKLNIKPEKMGIDMLSASAHKIHGPKGVGMLYIKKGIRVKPIVYGGHQQKNLRSGTENVFGAAGFCEAAKIAYDNIENNALHVKELNMRLKNQIKETICDTVFNSSDDALSHILNVSFLNVRSEILLHSLESRGIYVSSGSACSSNAPSPSRTLMSMGKDRKEIDSAIRFSFSAQNTIEEIDYTAKVLAQEVENIRKVMK